MQEYIRKLLGPNQSCQQFWTYQTTSIEITKEEEERINTRAKNLDKIVYFKISQFKNINI